MRNTNVIHVPPIMHEWVTIKDWRSFDISDWVSWESTTATENSWFEAEWFVVDQEWNPLVYGKSGFQRIPETDQDILDLARYPKGELDINNSLSMKLEGLFQNKVAKITQELYLPSIEISFNKGYSPTEMIRKVLLSFRELGDGLEEYGASFVPLGNLPISTPNVPNFANHYYEYLFNIRDGYDIAEFRGAALQLHKGIQDKNLAIYIFNKIRHLLPFFLAISWNSPFHKGIFRGNVSERTSTKSLWKMVWIPDAIDETFYSQLQEWLNTTIKSVAPYYYAVRYPRVDIRTIENCSMDMVHDVRIMIACMDLYYRITEKLWEHFTSNNPLPEKIFGRDSGCMIETNIIRENFHRAIRWGTETKFALAWTESGEQNLESLTQELLKWISNIPSTVPEDIQRKLRIPESTDFSAYILSQIIKNWNLGERTIKDFGLKKWPVINPLAIPTPDLQQLMKSVADSFRTQIQNTF